MKSLLRVSKSICCGLVWHSLNPINTGPDSLRFTGQRPVGIHLYSTHFGWFRVRRMTNQVSADPHPANLGYQEVWLVFLCVEGRWNTWAAWKHTDNFGASHLVSCQWGEKKKTCTSLLCIPFRLHRSEPSWTLVLMGEFRHKHWGCYFLTS